MDIALIKEKEISSALGKWSGLFLIFSFYTLAVFPAIFILEGADRWIAEAWDAKTGHIPLINYFLAHPKHVFSYPSLVSTFPGYHLFLAFISFLVGFQHIQENTWLIRIINTFFGYALLLAVWRVIWQFKKEAKIGVALLMPLALSYYVLASAIWVNTDNIAAFFYALLIFIFLTNQSPWFGAISSFCMVFCRQIYFPVMLAFWPPVFFPKINNRLFRLALSLTVFTTLLVLTFVWQWKGLTPAETQQLNKFVGINPSGLLHALALAGFLGMPYLFIFCADRDYYQKYNKLLMILTFIISITFWLWAPSTYDYDQGRGGSIIWHMARLTPHYGSHSFIIFILSLIGTFILVHIFFHAISRKYYPIETIMLLCYFVSYSAQIFSFQRYLEVPILITYAVFGSRITNIPRFSLIGPVLLSFLFIILSALHIWGKFYGGIS